MAYLLLHEYSSTSKKKKKKGQKVSTDFHIKVLPFLLSNSVKVLLSVPSLELFAKNTDTTSYIHIIYIFLFVKEQFI